MLRAMCPAVMIVTVTAVCFVNVARALFCQVQSAHILGNVFAVINFYPSYVTGNFKGEVKAKIKISPVVVFGVLSRMVVVRGS